MATINDRLDQVIATIKGGYKAQGRLQFFNIFEENSRNLEDLFLIFRLGNTGTEKGLVQLIMLFLLSLSLALVVLAALIPGILSASNGPVASQSASLPTPTPTATVTPTPTPSPTPTPRPSPTPKPPSHDFEGEGDGIWPLELHNGGIMIAQGWHNGDGKYVVRILDQNTRKLIDIPINCSNDCLRNNRTRFPGAGFYMVEVKAAGVYSFTLEWP